MKAVKVIVGVMAVVALLWLLYHVWQQRQFKAQLDAANAAYSAAKTSDEIEAAKKEFEALLPKAGTGEQKRLVEAGITTCDADVAYFTATNKGTIDNLSKAIDLMKKAQALGGDSNGQLANRIAELEPRLKADQGPTLDELKATLARLAAQPFDGAAKGLEDLLHWRAMWHGQGKYVDDKDREAVFSQVTAILKENYSRKFQANLAAAREPNATDEAKASIIEDLNNFSRIDAAATSALQDQYKDDFTRANQAAARLQAKTLGGAPPR